MKQNKKLTSAQSESQFLTITTWSSIIVTYVAENES